MKKTYINPEMVIVKIATQQMLAGSPAAIFDGKGSGEINLDPTEQLNPENPEDEVLGREDDFDDDF